MDDSYLGFVDLSSTLYGYVLSLNGSLVPTDADSQPTYTIFGPSGAMTSGTGTTSSVAGQTGFYSFSHSTASGNGYASGVTYTIKFDYEIDSTAYSLTKTFTVV